MSSSAHDPWHAGLPEYPASTSFTGAPAGAAQPWPELAPMQSAVPTQPGGVSPDGYAAYPHPAPLPAQQPAPVHQPAPMQQPAPTTAPMSSWSAAPAMQQISVTTLQQPMRDPSRTALAAVITFVVALVGLWAIFAYLGQMSTTLSSIVDGNAKMVAQLKTSNEGLRQLERKTSYVGVMNKDAAELRQLMAGLDQDMGTMLTNVGTIGDQMESVNTSMQQLGTGLDAANASSASIGTKLGTINSGLAEEATKVRTMRGDVVAASRSLVLLPPALRTTNARLTYINRNVSLMGTNGISNTARIRLTLLGIPNGSAALSGVIIPPGAWR